MTQMIQINKTHSNGKTSIKAPATKTEKRQYKTHSNGKTATKAEKRQYKTHFNGKTTIKAEERHSCHKSYCHKGRKASTCHKSIT